MSLTIYIGPNGFGKTTKLKSIRKSLVDSGTPESSILFLESEILLLDEMKDTKDESKTMEYILSELLNTPAIEAAKTAYENAVDAEVNSKTGFVNTIVDDILLLNGSTRSISIGRSGNTTLKNFIESRQDKEYKKLVKINSKEIIEGKMGSGQRMQLILSLVKNSSKTNVFIDEPEKYSHPSLLHRTAELISDLSINKDVFIATHSPKLLSMIDIDFSRLYVINDTTHLEKQINLSNICSTYSTYSSVLSTIPSCNKSYSYFNANGLIDNIKKLHYRPFIESLFAKKVYIVEGVSDLLFVNKVLQDNSKYYDEYNIFQTYGKLHMMLFATIFQELGIDVSLYFDMDNTSQTQHSSANTILRSFSNHYMFNPNIEAELGFNLHKSNTVAFINHIYSMSLPASYLV
ncbi:MAG: AAA family ATPase [Bacteroidales bacterium]|nr:AAA family ATPase [Bacteroidales bacterium]